MKLQNANENINGCMKKDGVHRSVAFAKSLEPIGCWHRLAMAISEQPLTADGSEWRDNRNMELLQLKIRASRAHRKLTEGVKTIYM